MCVCVGGGGSKQKACYCGMAGPMIWGGRGAGGGMGADRPVEPAWPGAEPVSSFIMLRPWGVQCTLHVSWSLGACHRLLRSGRGTYTPVCTCCGPYVRTVRTYHPLLRSDCGMYTALCTSCGPYVRIILYYDQTVGRKLHVARVVVRTYVSAFITTRPWGVHSTLCVLWSVRPSVRPSVIIILYYDQTVGCTLHSARVLVPTYVRIILYYDQTVGCTLHSARVVVRIMIRPWDVEYTPHVFWSLRTYVSSFIMIRPWDVHCTLYVLWSVRPYVRVILYYDQTVERTLNCARVVVRTYVLVILHYDQAMGRTLHVACVCGPYVRIIL